MSAPATANYETPAQPTQLQTGNIARASTRVTNSSTIPGQLHRLNLLERKTARSSALIAAIVMVVVMLSPPLARLFLLWSLLGGGFAVYLFLRRRPNQQAPFPPGAGARMGALTGAVAFAIIAVLFIAEQLVANYVLHHNEFMAEFRNRLQQAILANPDPQVHQMAHSLLTPQGMTTLLIAGLGLLFVIFLLLSSLGGLAAAAILGRSAPRE